MLFSKCKSNLKKHQAGFTLVELLIVIVVIAILAALVIIAFNGVRIRAIDSKLKTELNQASTKLTTLGVTDSTNAFPQDFSETGIESGAGEGQTTYLYNVNAEGTIYCLQAINSGRTFFVTNGNTNPQTGECEGTTGVPTDGNFTEELDLSGSQNQVVTNTSGTSQFIPVTVPAGIDYLTVHTSGGTEVGTFGVNIRVKYGAQPTSGSNDCSSINANGNLENCYMSNPTAGTWYIEHYPFTGSETYTNVDLVIEWGYWDDEYTSPETLSAGIWSRRYYKVEVPSGTDYLTAHSSGGTDTDWGSGVAMKYNARPGNTTSGFSGADCSSDGYSSNEESCYITNPTPGTWYILLASSVTPGQSGTYTNTNFAIDMGELEGAYSAPVTISAGPWERPTYTYTVPSGTDYVSFTTYNGSETGYGANLAIRYNALPGSNNLPSASADCNSMTTSNFETCFFYNPSAGTWYADVYSGGSFTATYNSVDFRIESGDWPGAYTAPVSVSGSYGYRTIYSYVVPAGKTSLTATLGGGTETSYGAGLAVKYNAWPGSITDSTANSDCNSNGTSNTESCVINNPTAGTYYISVYSAAPISNTSTFSNVTLTVTTAP